MKLKELTEPQIKEILTHAHLNTKSKIQKLPVGFSNDIYAVGSVYILKSGKSSEDDEYLKKEIYICNLLKGKVPAPTVVYSDTSKELTDRIYIIYEKIQGDNLYMKWHEYSIEQRKEIIRQICSFLRTINGVSYEDYAKKFGIDTNKTWREKLVFRIEQDRLRIIEQGSLGPELLRKIDILVNTNAPVLNESAMALTYFDVHFDNFIVRDGQIVGMLDFERTDILSIDYVLDVVQRMVTHPTKYASEEAEALIKPEDYKDLMNWYKEYYPELFQFPNLETRLKLYAIQHDLQQRYYWPNVKDLEEELSKNVK